MTIPSEVVSTVVTLSSKNFVTVIYGTRLRCLCSQCQWQKRSTDSLYFAGDKEGIARSDDLGRDLSSVQTLFTKQVCDMTHLYMCVLSCMPSYFITLFFYFRKLLTLVFKRLKTKESHVWQCWRMSWSNHNTNSHLPSLNVMMTLLGGKKLL